MKKDVRNQVKNNLKEDNELGPLPKEEEVEIPKVCDCRVKDMKGVRDMVECFDAIRAPKKDLVETLSVHSGMKIEEAQEVVDDITSNNLKESKYPFLDKLFDFKDEDLDKE